MIQPIPIFRGDSSDAFDVRTITISLSTEVDLTGATATFELLSFKKEFSPTTPGAALGKSFDIVIPNSATKKFPIGRLLGKFTLTDKEGRVLTPSCLIPFDVQIPGGSQRVKTKDVEIEIGVGVNYDKIFNKPTLNGMVIEGDHDTSYYKIEAGGSCKIDSVKVNGTLLEIDAEKSVNVQVKTIGDKPVVGEGNLSLADIGALSSSDTRIAGWNTASANSHTHTNKSVLDAITSAPIPATEKGAASGVATLGTDGKLTAAQMPSVSPSQITANAEDDGKMLKVVGGTASWATVSLKDLIPGSSSSGMVYVDGEWKAQEGYACDGGAVRLATVESRTATSRAITFAGTGVLVGDIVNVHIVTKNTDESEVLQDVRYKGVTVTSGEDDKPTIPGLGSTPGLSSVRYIEWIESTTRYKLYGLDTGSYKFSVAIDKVTTTTFAPRFLPDATATEKGAVKTSDFASATHMHDAGDVTATLDDAGKVLKVNDEGNAVWGDGEPEEYLKSVSFQVGKVMLTKKDGEEVEVTADDLGAYVKSDDGIPYDDLDEGVQSSLDLADSAVQDVSDKRGIADRRSYRYEWSDDNLPSDCIFKVQPYYDGMSGAWQCIVKDDVEGYEYRCTASGNASSTELTFTGINHLGASFSFGTEAEDDTEYVPDDGNLLALESQVPTIDEKAKWNAKLSPVSGTTDTAPKAAALTTSGESALLSKVDTRVSAACATKADSTTMAPAFSTTTAYAKDSWVTKDGKLYCAKSAVTAGEWNASKWEEKQVMSNPDYQLVTDDTNTMRVIDKTTTLTETLWADEYKLATESATDVHRNCINRIVLTSGEEASITHFVPTFPTALTGYARDFLVQVELPETVEDGHIIQPIDWPGDFVYVGSDDPLASFKATDTGKTFLFAFCDLPNGKILVSRQELKASTTSTPTT